MKKNNLMLCALLLNITLLSFASQSASSGTNSTTKAQKGLEIFLNGDRLDAHHLVDSSSHDVLKRLDALKLTNVLVAHIELLNTRTRQLETDLSHVQQTHDQFKQQHAACSQSQHWLSKNNIHKLIVDQTYIKLNKLKREALSGDLEAVQALDLFEEGVYGNGSFHYDVKGCSKLRILGLTTGSSELSDHGSYDDNYCKIADTIREAFQALKK